MVLVDTSVWVTHLREGADRLAELLNEGLVCCHPFVIGELACGSLKNRDGNIIVIAGAPVCGNRPARRSICAYRKEPFNGKRARICRCSPARIGPAIGRGVLD